MSFDKSAWQRLPEVMARNRARVMARGHRHTAQMATIKLASGCVDCGYNEVAGRLHFDHRVGERKLFNIACAGTRSRESVAQELAKCDIRCVVCHARRHAREG